MEFARHPVPKQHAPPCCRTLAVAQPRHHPPLSFSLFYKTSKTARPNRQPDGDILQYFSADDPSPTPPAAHSATFLQICKSAAESPLLAVVRLLSNQGRGASPSRCLSHHHPRHILQNMASVLLLVRFSFAINTSARPCYKHGLYMSGMPGITQSKKVKSRNIKIKSRHTRQLIHL